MMSPSMITNLSGSLRACAFSLDLIGLLATLSHSQYSILLTIFFCLIYFGYRMFKWFIALAISYLLQDGAKDVPVAVCAGQQTCHRCPAFSGTIHHICPSTGKEPKETGKMLDQDVDKANENTVIDIDEKKIAQELHRLAHEDLFQPLLNVIEHKILSLNQMIEKVEKNLDASQISKAPSPMDAAPQQATSVDEMKPISVILENRGSRLSSVRPYGSGVRRFVKLATPEHQTRPQTFPMTQPSSTLSQTRSSNKLAMEQLIQAIPKRTTASSSKAPEGGLRTESSTSLTTSEAAHLVHRSFSHDITSVQTPSADKSFTTAPSTAPIDITPILSSMRRLSVAEETRPESRKLVVPTDRETPIGLSQNRKINQSPTEVSAEKNVEGQNLAVVSTGTEEGSIRISPERVVTSLRDTTIADENTTVVPDTMKDKAIEDQPVLDGKDLISAPNRPQLKLEGMEEARHEAAITTKPEPAIVQYDQISSQQHSIAEIESKQLTGRPEARKVRVNKFPTRSKLRKAQPKNGVQKHRKPSKKVTFTLPAEALVLDNISLLPPRSLQVDSSDESFKHTFDVNSAVPQQGVDFSRLQLPIDTKSQHAGVHYQHMGADTLGDLPLVSPAQSQSSHEPDKSLEQLESSKKKTQASTDSSEKPVQQSLPGQLPLPEFSSTVFKSKAGRASQIVIPILTQPDISDSSAGAQSIPPVSVPGLDLVQPDSVSPITTSAEPQQSDMSAKNTVDAIAQLETDFGMITLDPPDEYFMPKEPAKMPRGYYGYLQMQRSKFSDANTSSADIDTGVSQTVVDSNDTRVDGRKEQFLEPNSADMDAMDVSFPDTAATMDDSQISGLETNIGLFASDQPSSFVQMGAEITSQNVAEVDPTRDFDEDIEMMDEEYLPMPQASPDFVKAFHHLEELSASTAIKGDDITLTASLTHQDLEKDLGVEDASPEMDSPQEKWLDQMDRFARKNNSEPGDLSWLEPLLNISDDESDQLGIEDGKSQENLQPVEGIADTILRDEEQSHGLLDATAVEQQSQGQFEEQFQEQFQEQSQEQFQEQFNEQFNEQFQEQTQQQAQQQAEQSEDFSETQSTPATTSNQPRLSSLGDGFYGSDVEIELAEREDKLEVVHLWTVIENQLNIYIAEWPESYRDKEEIKVMRDRILSVKPFKGMSEQQKINYVLTTVRPWILSALKGIISKDSREAHELNGALLRGVQVANADERSESLEEGEILSSDSSLSDAPSSPGSLIFRRDELDSPSTEASTETDTEHTKEECEVIAEEIVTASAQLAFHHSREEWYQALIRSYEESMKQLKSGGEPQYGPIVVKLRKILEAFQHPEFKASRKLLMTRIKFYRKGIVDAHNQAIVGEVGARKCASKEHMEALMYRRRGIEAARNTYEDESFNVEQRPRLPELVKCLKKLKEAYTILINDPGLSSKVEEHNYLDCFESGDNQPAEGYPPHIAQLDADASDILLAILKRQLKIVDFKERDCASPNHHIIITDLESDLKDLEVRADRLKSRLKSVNADPDFERQEVDYLNECIKALKTGEKLEHFNPDCNVDSDECGSVDSEDAYQHDDTYDDAVSDVGSNKSRDLFADGQGEDEETPEDHDIGYGLLPRRRRSASLSSSGSSVKPAKPVRLRLLMPGQARSGSSSTQAAENQQSQQSRDLPPSKDRKPVPVGERLPGVDYDSDGCEISEAE